MDRSLGSVGREFTARVSRIHDCLCFAVAQPSLRFERETKMNPEWHITDRARAVCRLRAGWGRLGSEGKSPHHPIAGTECTAHTKLTAFALMAAIRADGGSGPTLRGASRQAPRRARHAWPGRTPTRLVQALPLCGALACALVFVWCDMPRLGEGGARRASRRRRCGSLRARLCAFARLR